MTTATIKSKALHCCDCGSSVYPEEEGDSGYCNDCNPQHTCAVCDDLFGRRDMGDVSICDNCINTHSYCIGCFKWLPCDDFAGQYCRNCHYKAWDCRVSDEAPGGVSWEDYEAWAEKSCEFDFGCGFNCDGCVAMRSGNSAAKHGCCVNCAGMHGYLCNVKREALPTVKALYDENAGFLTPTGCALPVKWRSLTCLHYSCDIAKRNEKRDSDGIKAWMGSRSALVQLS